MADINTLEYTAAPSRALFSTGEKFEKIVASYAKLAGHTTGVVVLARNVPIATIVTGIKFPKGTAAIADFTDLDIGFRRSSDDTVLDADALVDGISFASARDYGIDVLGDNVSGFLRNETIGDLLDLQEDEAPIGGVDIIATINTGGANTGTLVFEIELNKNG